MKHTDRIRKWMTLFTVLFGAIDGALILGEHIANFRKPPELPAPAEEAAEK